MKKIITVLLAVAITASGIPMSFATGDVANVPVEITQTIAAESNEENLLEVSFETFIQAMADHLTEDEIDLLTEVYTETVEKIGVGNTASGDSRWNQFEYYLNLLLANESKDYKTIGEWQIGMTPSSMQRVVETPTASNELQASDYKSLVVLTQKLADIKELNSKETIEAYGRLLSIINKEFYKSNYKNSSTLTIDNTYKVQNNDVVKHSDEYLLNIYISSLNLELRAITPDEYKVLLAHYNEARSLKDKADETPYLDKLELIQDILQTYVK